MDTERVEQALIDKIVEDNNREKEFGKYHPSTVSGCPLKGTLDRLTDIETVPNSWLFQGTAVHHYMQETDVLDTALHNAGYHVLDTEYEVHTLKEVNEDIFITGTCDILCEGEEGRTIFDIKYTSLKPQYDHPRMYKYYSQINTYCHMFNADEAALILINSKSQDLTEDIYVVDWEVDQKNWELVQKKIQQIHEILDEYDYEDGNRFSQNELSQWGATEWGDFMDVIDRGDCPAYDGECKYCDHEDYCPVVNGDVGGLGGFKGGVE